ncbi:MAG: prepilin-type N-terminal cleavage/methylation domain-containing protein [Elusimicrobia bacterium]|nr:prepilin-type N-terminal cleavage/methylation domain-containing protein [Elusimicrobiota bacterium]
MKNRPGLSLIELLVALVLSTFVLVAIVGVVSQMLRYEFEGNRKAISTNWSKTAQDQITKDLTKSSVIYCPSASGVNYTGYTAACTAGTSSVLVGCSNYSVNPAMSGRQNTNENVLAYHYCVWCGGSGPPNGCVTPTTTPWLLRYAAEGAAQTCPLALPNCGATAGYTVIAQDFYLNAANNWYFKRDDGAAQVEIQFMVGIGTRSLSGILNTAVPTAQRARFRVDVNKNVGNSLD